MKRPIVMWGHVPGPGANTLAYVWAGYAKAFRALGHEVWHLADLQGWKLPSDALVFAEGQEDRHLALRPDCTYVLHNVDALKYRDQRRLFLQVYTTDVHERRVRLLGEWSYHQPAPDCLGVLYQPWATDLLPDEIDPAHPPDQVLPVCGWVGTIGDGVFGNRAQLLPFIASAAARGLTFQHREGLTPEAHRAFLEPCREAPVVVGAWQLGKCYVPCRLWKTMSYGHRVVSNQPRFMERYADMGRAEVMAFVKSDHTFVNRIARILEIVG